MTEYIKYCPNCGAKWTEETTMRLIDADALNKKKKYSFRTVGQSFRELEPYIKVADLFDVPTTDAVPVVRCKDCRYFIDLNCYASNLLRGNPRVPGIHLTGANDFCSYGERRND